MTKSWSDKLESSDSGFLKGRSPVKSFTLVFLIVSAKTFKVSDLMQSEGYHEKNVLSTLGMSSVVHVIFFFKVILGEELTNSYLLLQNRSPRPDPDTLWVHSLPAVQCVRRSPL